MVEVRDRDGAPLDDGVVGELWVRGPNIMLGYLHRPEESQQALVDGWYRTGDLGYSDSDGYLFLVDRLKDMIISGGENVYSIEVERAIAAHDAVAEVAVIGVPDDRWGERVHAVIFPNYKVPKSVDVRTDPLPKSGAGKILKQDIRQQAYNPLSPL